MTNSEIQSKTTEIKTIHDIVLQTFGEDDIILEDTLLGKYVTVIFTNQIKPVAVRPNNAHTTTLAKGAKGKKSKTFTFNPPQGQIMEAGEVCLRCGDVLKLSSKGNAYCQCFYEN